MLITVVKKRGGGGNLANADVIRGGWGWGFAQCWQLQAGEGAKLAKILMASYVTRSLD